MKFISLFAGIGGFDLALQRNGHECVYANEWDQFASKIYEKNFSQKPDTRDIRTVPISSIPDHDILVGGFPCQAFSIAGKRRGFDETRGTLFFEIARILAEKYPGFFILENVKGLLSHDGGNTFKTIVTTLDGLGYDLQWQVLNSKNFGVPQNRERVYIVGHLRGQPRPQIFPITGSNPEYLREITRGVSDAQRIYDTDGIGKTLKGLGGGQGAKTGLYAITETRTEESKQIRREMRKQGKDWSPRRGKKLVARTDGMMGTLTSSRNLENILTDFTNVRRLTPVECERLQGFPDNWTVGISDSQRYKCLGNAVTVNVVDYIVKNLS